MQRNPHRTALAGPAGLALLAALGLAMGGCAQGSGSDAALEAAAATADPDDLLIVDCLLPGQVRQLGAQATYVTARRPARIPAIDCRIKGGEYVAFDQADFGTALKVWLPKAKDGDAEAQNLVGEIHERGLGVEPDYAAAAAWYRKAADQGLSEALINLGQLYDRGLGVEKDPARARALYREASGLPEEEVPFVSESAPEQRKLEQPGPEIQLIDPPIDVETRGISVIHLTSAVAQRLLVGRVVAPAGVTSLVVNDREVDLEDNGLFRTRVPVEGDTKVTVRAVDRQGKSQERTFTLTSPGSTTSPELPEPARPAGVDFGRSHALVIGNDAYRQLPPLKTARRDAEAVSKVLSERYGFRVVTLFDATRYDILSSLNELRAELTSEDNLLVYYAGHGELDEKNDRGNWLPIDAEPTSTANWISNVAVTDILNAMNARHVLVVSDSCYSGTLTRAALARLDGALTDDQRLAWQRAMASKRSRTALTSGGLAPVLDAGGGEHSVFAQHFLEVLERNADVLEGQRLHQEIAARVTYSAGQLAFEQVPQYAPIRFSGHESGDFFFVPSL